MSDLEYHKEHTVVRSIPGKLFHGSSTDLGSEFETTINRGDPWTLTNELDGVKNPNWRDQVRRGSSATTILNGVEHRLTLRPGYTSYRYDIVPPESWNPSWVRHVWLRDISVAPTIPLDDPDYIVEDEADQQALTELGQKIRKVQQTFSGGIAIGELAQTIALIKNPAAGLRRLVSRHSNRALKRGARDKRKLDRLSGRRRRKLLQQLRKDVADQWLEVQFGWKPLINDVADGLKAFADHYHRTDNYDWRTVRAVGGTEAVSYGKPQPFGTISPNQYVRKVYTERATVRYIAMVSVGSRAVYDATRMGVNAREWPVIAWELIPYSFLADYFTNIGDIIQNAAIARSGVRWIVRTVRKERSEEHIGVAPAFTSDPVNTVSPTAFTPQYFKVEAKRISRTPYTGTLVPDLDFSVPGTSGKWLNIAALWSNARQLRSYYR